MREGASSGAIGLRMFSAVLLAFVLVGIGGYVILQRGLVRRQLNHYAGNVRADARGFEQLSVYAGSPEEIIAHIKQFLIIVQQRPGSVNSELVDPQGIIRAAGNQSMVGTRVPGREVSQALRQGIGFAGREQGRDDRDNFEFVVPVRLGSQRFGRWAYAVTYDDHAYKEQLGELQAQFAVDGLLALVLGGAVFYLVGGRQLMRAHRALLHRATRDSLTELPNHRAFQDEFPRAVLAAQRYGYPLAVVMIDVDDFKLANDRHGHSHGDAMLQRLADVLRDLRPGDRAYRVGGDEFVVLLAHADAEGGSTFAERLCRTAADAGLCVSAGVSALRSEHSAETLLAEADAALYEAKRNGGERSVLFDASDSQATVITAEKKEAVRRLVNEGRLTVEFQPIWDLASYSLLGVEALARPDRAYGLAGPAEAFDIAETLGRVHQLDELCVARTLEAAPAAEGNPLLFLNLSPLTLDMDAHGNDWLLQAVRAAGLAPEQIVIEVTERFGGRTQAVVASLQRLRAHGFRLAIDDVGTGNSGLEMLSRIGADFVKIDRGIIAAAATEPAARAVLLAMATFARHTGAFVIAEGIEDLETLRFLHDLGDFTGRTARIIEGGQGYGLGRPSPQIPRQVPDILREHDPSSPVSDQAISSVG